MTTGNAVHHQAKPATSRHARWFEPAPAVRWLQPGELLRSAVRAVIGSTFGEYADRREMMAALPTTDHDERSRRQDETLWFDFVADVGDGFDSTVSVAQAIADDRIDLSQADLELIRRSRTAPSDDPLPDHLPRGAVLVMGGDEVYPYATRREYRERTVGPYELALPWVGTDDTDHMSLYALPGNHDWYDGLSAFQKVFMAEEWIGAWKTKQTRSYFSVRLTDTCWLWAVDVALGGHMDRPQVAYFREQSERMTRGWVETKCQQGDHSELGHSIIISLAKPSWEEPQVRRDVRAKPNDVKDLLEWLQGEVVPKHASVVLALSGDKHFYARRTASAASAEPQHLVIAGGGGAYLSSTRGLEPDVVMAGEPSSGNDPQRSTYRLETTYPSAKAADRLARRKAWSRILGTGWLVATIGAIYTVLGALLLAGSRTGDSRSGLTGHLTGLVQPSLSLVVAGGLVAAISAGLYGLARYGKADLRAAFGLTGAHLAGHVSAILLVATISSWLGQVVGGPAELAAAVPLLVGGGPIGTVVFITYLLGAQHFGVNLNELFSGLRYEGYKNFLRLAVRNDRIDVFAIGLDTVSPRSIDWEHGGRLLGYRAVPRLIDYFQIPLSRPARTAGGDDDPVEAQDRDNHRQPSTVSIIDGTAVSQIVERQPG